VSADVLKREEESGGKCSFPFCTIIERLSVLLIQIETDTHTYSSLLSQMDETAQSLTLADF